jgi:hypothetical protein
MTICLPLESIQLNRLAGNWSRQKEAAKNGPPSRFKATAKSSGDSRKKAASRSNEKKAQSVGGG